MTQFPTTGLQRDKTFEPSGVSGKLKFVLPDVSGTLLRTLGTIDFYENVWPLVPPGRSNADMMER